jgi:hypothetical protein
MPQIGEVTVKELTCKNSKNRGERSWAMCAQTQQNHWDKTSFIFHPASENNNNLLLLSSFTYTHAYAPAHAYMDAYKRGGEKEERSLFGLVRYSSPDRHHCPNDAFCLANSSLTRTSSCNATVGQLWPHVWVCQFGTSNSVQNTLMGPTPPLNAFKGRGKGWQLRQSFIS